MHGYEGNGGNYLGVLSQFYLLGLCKRTYSGSPNPTRSSYNVADMHLYEYFLLQYSTSEIPYRTDICTSIYICSLYKHLY